MTEKEKPVPVPPFLVIIYDYDAAPDAEVAYFVGRRLKLNSFRDAKLTAEHYVEERFFSGAKILDANKSFVWGIGVNLDEPKPSEARGEIDGLSEVSSSG